MGERAPSPADKYIASRVRTRRRALGMSQGKLGEALGLTFQQVQKYERGTNRIGAGRLLHVAHVLDIPITFFRARSEGQWCVAEETVTAVDRADERRAAPFSIAGAQ